ncbi:DUF2975 domain-containing protein [Anaerosporobacter sp.]
MNQRNLSKWLRFITILVGIMLTFVIFMIIPAYGRDVVCVNQNLSSWYMPWLLFVWGLGVPCYVVLFVFWGICSEIHNDNSFSLKNAKALATISKLALIDSVICFLGIVLFSIIGIIHFTILILSVLVIMFGVAVSIIAAALGHLVQKASKMKEENDLTI